MSKKEQAEKIQELAGRNSRALPCLRSVGLSQEERINITNKIIKRFKVKFGSDIFDDSDNFMKYFKRDINRDAINDLYFTGIAREATVKTACGDHGEFDLSHYELVAALYEIFYRFGRFSRADPKGKNKNR